MLISTAVLSSRYISLLICDRDGCIFFSGDLRGFRLAVFRVLFQKFCHDRVPCKLLIWRTNSGSVLDRLVTKDVTAYCQEIFLSMLVLGCQQEQHNVVWIKYRLLRFRFVVLHIRQEFFVARCVCWCKCSIAQWLAA